VTSLFGKLPGWIRLPLVAAIVAAGVWWTMRSLVHFDGWSWEIGLGAVLGALAAWRFRWRAQGVWSKRLLAGAVSVFAIAMIVAHVRGLDHGNTAFFLFSVLLVSLPYGRALGREERAAARHEAEMAREKEREDAARKGAKPPDATSG
jgi:hypothetical protein